MLFLGLRFNVTLKVCVDGDVFVSIIVRRVQTESATGSVSSNKVRTTLAIAVEGIEFDTQACMLRIKGRNVEENQYVKVAYCYVCFYLYSPTLLALQLPLVAPGWFGVSQPGASVIHNQKFHTDDMSGQEC